MTSLAVMCGLLALAWCGLVAIGLTLLHRYCNDLDEPWQPTAWTDQDQTAFEQHADWNGNR